MIVFAINFIIAGIKQFIFAITFRVYPGRTDALAYDIFYRRFGPFLRQFLVVGVASTAVGVRAELDAYAGILHHYFHKVVERI